MGGFHNSLLGAYLPEWLMDLREMFAYVHPFIIKDYYKDTEESLMKKYGRVRSGSVLGSGTSVPWNLG